MIKNFKKMMSSMLLLFAMSFPIVNNFNKTNSTSNDSEKASTTMNSNAVIGVNSPKGRYNEGVVLVKTDSLDLNNLGCISYSNVNQLYPNSKWYKI